jgi:hypothetical protein
MDDVSLEAEGGPLVPPDAGVTLFPPSAQVVSSNLGSYHAFPFY